MNINKDEFIVTGFLLILIVILLCIQAYILGKTRGELTVIEDNTVVIKKCKGGV